MHTIFRSLRSCLTGVLVAAMLGHAALVPLHLSMRLANAATAALDALIAAEICSVNGSAHVPDGSTPSEAERCSVCIGMAAFHLMMPPPSAQAEILNPKSSAIAALETEKRIRLIKLSAQSRGPPSSV